MAKQYYLLSPEDRAAILELAKRVGNMRQNDMANTDDDFQEQGTDIYVAHPPCPHGIPPRVGDVPGVEYCCVFRLVPRYHGADIHDLEPMLYADGTQVTKRVFNLDEVWVPSEYIIIRKEKGGRWVADKPLEVFGTTTTTTPYPDSLHQSCEGTCQWIWNDSVQRWAITQNNCRDSTTTTEFPTTTTECPCNLNREPEVEQTTLPPTTTLTPTTAYPGPCECLYPPFCGQEQGDVTETGCSTREYDGNVECPDTTTTAPPTSPPPTTTTTCDCNTTTAEPASQCSGGCDWVWQPFSNSWAKSVDRCSSDCPCPPPNNVVGDECEPYHTGCVPKTTLPPAEREEACVGECTYWWFPELQSWQVYFSDCRKESLEPGSSSPVFSRNYTCECEPPSEPGNECARMTIPCVKEVEEDDPLNTTTTLGPGHCAECYPTTLPPVTTSTTCSPEAGEQQLFVCSNGAWLASENCACYNDLIPGCGGYDDPNGQPCDDEGAWLNCGCESTTTTTTTCDPCTSCAQCLWKWSVDCDDWVLVKNPCDNEVCDCPKPMLTGIANQYQQTGCGTTPEPAINTTTVAPSQGCNPRHHDCIYKWSDSCAKYVLMSSSCGAGCGCDEPAATVGVTGQTTRMPCTTSPPTTSAPTTTGPPTTTTTVCPTTEPPPPTTPAPAPTTTTCDPDPATIFTRDDVILRERVNNERLTTRTDPTTTIPP